MAWAVLARDRAAGLIWRGQGERSVRRRPFAPGLTDEGRARAQGFCAARVWAIPGRTRAGLGQGGSLALRAGRRRLSRRRFGEERF